MEGLQPFTFVAGNEEDMLERSSWCAVENGKIKTACIGEFASKGDCMRIEDSPEDFLSPSTPGQGRRLTSGKGGGRREKDSFPFLNLHDVVNHHVFATFVWLHLHIKHLFH